MIAAAVAAVASPVFAAPGAAGDDPAPANGALEAAGAFLGGFNIEGQVNTLYDSNMRRVGDGVALPPGTQKDDWRITPVVTVSTGLPIGRQRLSVSGTIGRDFYANGSRPDSTWYGARTALDWQLGARCAGTFDFAYNKRQLLLSDASFADENVREDVNYGGYANCRVSSNVGFGVGVRQAKTRNEDPARQSFDTNSLAVSPQLTYGTPVFGEFSLGGTYNSASYPNRLILTEGLKVESDAIEIISGRVGYRRGLGSRLSVNVGISYYNTKPKPETILFPVPPVGQLVPVTRTSTSNMGYDFGIAYNSGSRLTASATASQRATNSINIGAQSQLVQHFGLNVDYKMNSKVSVDTGVSYVKRDLRNSFASANEPLARQQDKVALVHAGVTYAPTTRYSASFDVSYQERKSTPDIYSYSSVAAMFTVRVNVGRH